MDTYSYHIGVDVSKSKLDFVILERLSLKVLKHLQVENAEEGISKIFKYLEQNEICIENALFCSENTGIYTFPLTLGLALRKADLWIIHAMEIKLSKGLVRGKNDKTDAREIALYSIRHFEKLRLYRAPVQDIQKLRLLFAEREKTSKALLILNSTKENKDFSSATVFHPIEMLNLRIVNQLKIHRTEIELKMLETIDRNCALSKHYKLITSVPGIGKMTAIYLVITTGNFSQFENWRKYACYAGVAPFEHESGSSVKRNARIHRFGNRKIKTMLRMCALTCLRHDTQLREYYKKKKNEGKHHSLILNNIKCKLISRVFAVVKRNTPLVDVNGFAN